MALSVTSRSVGEVTVIDCAGRFVEGPATAPLQQLIEYALPVAPFFVLRLHDVDFIDSGGVGLLVRLLNRARQAGGDLRLCDMSSRVADVLRVTRLTSLFDCRATDGEAVEAFYVRAAGPAAAAQGNTSPDVLCVDPSPSVVAYARELITQLGFGVMTTTNLADAMTLVRATRPRVLLLNPQLHQSTAADAIKRSMEGMLVVEIPDGFATGDAAEMGDRLLADVRNALEGSSGTAAIQT